MTGRFQAGAGDRRRHRRADGGGGIGRRRREVILVEKSASLGGRVARMHQYFPKLCPPACGLEMHYRRLRNHPAITVLTLAEVVEVTWRPGRVRGHRARCSRAS